MLCSTLCQFAADAQVSHPESPEAKETGKLHICQEASKLILPLCSWLVRSYLAVGQKCVPKMEPW